MKAFKMVKQRCKKKQENPGNQWLWGILRKFSSKDEGINARMPNIIEKENLSGCPVVKIKLSMF